MPEERAAFRRAYGAGIEHAWASWPRDDFDACRACALGLAGFDVEAIRAKQNPVDARLALQSP